MLQTEVKIPLLKVLFEKNLLNVVCFASDFLAARTTTAVRWIALRKIHISLFVVMEQVQGAKGAKLRKHLHCRVNDSKALIREEYFPKVRSSEGKNL